MTRSSSFSSPRGRRASCVLALTLALAGGHAGVHAAEPSEFSKAEKIVFVDHHLANIKEATALRYSFVKSGSLEPGFEDEVRLEMRPNKDGKSTNVSGRFMSAERRESLPEIESALSNPAILYFLERDIREMERLTKGKSGYFRKRIRLGMVEAATVRETTVSFGGRNVPATEVSLSPYEADPLRTRFERYALKRYVFVIADAVPGGVYQVRTALPGALPTDAPVLEESMTFSGTAAASRPSAKPSATPGASPTKAAKP